MELDPSIKSSLIKKITVMKKGFIKDLNKLSEKALSSLRQEIRTHSSDTADMTGLPNISINRIPNLKKLIQKCDEALERLENGTYGTCSECGEPILVSRLIASPFTDACTECKAEKERRDSIIVNGSTKRLSRTANSVFV